MIDVILDLETLGTRPGCAIIEIGACAVDADTGLIVSNFSRRVAGCVPELVEMVAAETIVLSWIDRATAVWWCADSGRRETLRRILSSAGAPLRRALLQFGEWYSALGGAPQKRIWANGPSFDIAILEAAYHSVRIPPPWFYWQERCVRTALELCGYEKGGLPWAEAGPRHRALCDARHEARKLWHCGALGTVSRVARRLRERGTV